jgi:hypothetical protein
MLNEGEFPILGGVPESRRAQRELGLAKYVPSLGSEKTDCHLCDDGVWLGPNQLRFRREHPEALVVCPACAVNAGMKMDEVRSLGGRGGDFTFSDGTRIAPDNSKN